MSSSIDQQSRSPDPQATDADSAAVGAAAAARSIAGQQPDLADVLALESRVRRQGTGLQVEDLLGLWRPERIWPRAGRRGSALTEALLRGLSASLRIEPSAPAMAAGSGGCGEDGGPGDGLWLSNAVRLGPFALRFQGPGRLQGRRPLLVFHFERLEVLAAERLLLQRSLPAPDPRRLPFFALIGVGNGAGGAWLAARGRSGGLAVWRRDPGAAG